MHLHELNLNEPLIDHLLPNDAPSVIIIVLKVTKSYRDDLKSQLEGKE